MRIVVVPSPLAYADVGPFAATLSLHPYLQCDTCGQRLYEGPSAAGPLIYGCLWCKRIVDTRRVP